MTPDPRQSKPRGAAGEPSFEDALQQLEDLIEQIEGGEIGLEKSIAEYERGIGLIKRCREILERAELRVEELGKDQAKSRPDRTPERPPSRASSENGGNGDSDDSDAPF